MRTATALSAGALLGTSVFATPVPQQDAPTDVFLENIDKFEVMPYKDIQASTVLNTSKGSFTIESRMYEFRGCGGNQSIIQQAWVDALRIVNSVGRPHGVIGFPSDEPHKDKGQEVMDYWGRESNWHNPGAQNTVAGNYRRAQVGGTEGWAGDWWYDRYYQVVCDDPGARCTKENLFAYEDDPETTANPGRYPRISICPDFFTHKMPSLDQRIKDLKDSSFFKPENPLYLQSQGSTLLHELFHTKCTNVARRDNPGISNPKAVDHRPHGGNQKAYGPARAKYLAKMEDAGKASLVFTNVDNYVYYALSTFMMKEFNVPYPKLPPASWPYKAASEGEQEQFAADGDANAVEADFTTEEKLLTDEQLYAQSGSTTQPPPSNNSPTPSNNSPPPSNNSPTPSNNSPPPSNNSPPPSNNSPPPNNG